MTGRGARSPVPCYWTKALRSPHLPLWDRALPYELPVEACRVVTHVNGVYIMAGRSACWGRGATTRREMRIEEDVSGHLGYDRTIPTNMRERLRKETN
jgi:hypothetical protein